MNPFDAWRALGMAGKAVAVGLALLILVGLWWAILGRPAHDRRIAAEARGAAIVASGQAKAAQDAIGVITAHEKAEAATDYQAKEAEDAIRAAPEDQRNAVALSRLCLSDAASRQPACVELLKSRPR